MDVSFCPGRATHVGGFRFVLLSNPFTIDLQSLMKDTRQWRDETGKHRLKWLNNNATLHMLVSRRDDGEARDRAAAFLKPSPSLSPPHASSNSLNSDRDNISDLCQ
jgi:hypothetical protein